MLSEYEAAHTGKTEGADRPALTERRPEPHRHRCMVALSLLSAVGLLYSAFFRARGACFAQRGPRLIATPIIHPSERPSGSGAVSPASFEAVLTVRRPRGSIDPMEPELP